METTPLSKRSVAFGLALAVACIANALIVVVKEKSDAVMAGMKKVTGHHWTTHSLFVLVLFLGLGALFAQLKGGRGIAMSAGRLMTTLVSSVIVATLIILGFYLLID
jgi:hypothetical protein